MPYRRVSERWYSSLDTRTDTQERSYDEESIKRQIEDFITWSWRDIVCMCYVPTDKKMENGKFSVMFCGNCDKYRRWLYRECSHCGSIFIYHFKHHAAGPATYRNCFDCLTKKYGTEEGDENFCTATPRPPRAIEDILPDNFGEFDLGL